MDKTRILVTLILTVKYLLKNRSTYRIKGWSPIDRTGDFRNRNNESTVRMDLKLYS